MNNDSTDVIINCLERQANERGLVLDASQQAAIIRMQRLHDELMRPATLRRLLSRVIKAPVVRGLYLWGGVGRGKSFVMDGFFACVALKPKRRLHFHQFMQEIHSRLAQLNGQINPLGKLAASFAQQVRLLCLDEFHISDITDAMLMRGLLQGLIEEGVVLVITSNAEPDALYRNGLQRSQFIPCIDLIKSNLEVLYLDGGTDYRRNALEQIGVYHTPLNVAADQALLAAFRTQAGTSWEQDVSLQVNDRIVVARYLATGVAWFEFAELCDEPRGKTDYMLLAGRYKTLLLSGVPQFGSQSIDVAKRFLWLIDALYDRHVKLIVSAAVPLQQLAPPELFGGEIERAISRLAEMQSHAYLAQHHPPR